MDHERALWTRWQDDCLQRRQSRQRAVALRHPAWRGRAAVNWSRGTHLLAVSAKGEIAAITGARLAHHRIFTGTLSRMTMEGGARPWMEDVSEADFAPDGSVAVIRRRAGSWHLEYPAGTVLYTAPTGSVSDLRVSPTPCVSRSSITRVLTTVAVH